MQITAWWPILHSYKKNRMKQYFPKLTEIEKNKIDVWRGILTFLVLICHSFQFFAPTNFWDFFDAEKTHGFFHYCAIAFLVMSGFVIFYSLENNYLNKKTVSYKDFLIARISRLYPPLFLIFICTYVLKILNKILKTNILEYNQLSMFDYIDFVLLKNLNIGKVNAPLWTLMFEMWYYVLAILIFKCFRTTKKGTIILNISICSCILLFMYKNISPNSLLYFALFLIGPTYLILKKVLSNKIILIVSLLFSLLFFIINFTYFKNQSYLQIWWMQILLAITFVGALFSVPDSKNFKKIATFSYTLYIIHYPVFLFFNHYLTKNYLTIIISICSIMSISYFVSRFIEQKNNFKNFIYKHF